jgi:hypothetical protein
MIAGVKRALPRVRLAARLRGQRGRAKRDLLAVAQIFAARIQAAGCKLSAGRAELQEDMGLAQRVRRRRNSIRITADVTSS